MAVVQRFAADESERAGEVGGVQEVIDAEFMYRGVFERRISNSVMADVHDRGGHIRVEFSSRAGWRASGEDPDRRRRTMRMSCIFLGTAAWSCVSPALGAPPSFADFNGDGFTDLITGCREETTDASGVVLAGCINVIFGSPVGLAGGGSQFFTQNTAGILDTCETQDYFGHAVASGDFDGDGFSEAMIGIIEENVGARDTGAVSVLFGTGGGLTAAGDQFIHQNVPGVDETAERGDSFGTDVAVGNFNGDAFDDAVVGISGESVGAVGGAGAFQAFYGSPAGFTAVNDQWITQNSGGILDTAEAGDLFGLTVTCGDFDGDGFDDVAAVSWGEDVSGVSSSGAFNVIYGSGAGLAAAGNQLFSQDSPGMADTCEIDDLIGWNMVAGDFNGDGFDDLAVGCPFEDVGAIVDAGAVMVLYGSAAGLSSAGNQFWTQNAGAIADSCEADDQFGFSVASGDFNGDGRDDLVIGADEEDLGGITNAGVVHVLLGSAAGLTDVGNQLWSQDTAGILDLAEIDDFFGWSVGTGDYNGDGHDDLAIGCVSEGVVFTDDGAINVLYGGTAGLTSAGNQIWHQDSAGVGGASNGESFGYSIATP